MSLTTQTEELPDVGNVRLCAFLYVIFISILERPEQQNFVKFFRSLDPVRYHAWL